MDVAASESVTDSGDLIFPAFPLRRENFPNVSARVRAYIHTTVTPPAQTARDVDGEVREDAARRETVGGLRVRRPFVILECP